jgi:hypothetical protein
MYDRSSITVILPYPFQQLLHRQVSKQWRRTGTDLFRGTHTTNAQNENRTGPWSEEHMRSVHYFWDNPRKNMKVGRKEKLK